MAAPRDIVPPTEDALREQLCVRVTEVLRLYQAVYGIHGYEQIPDFVREALDSMPDPWVRQLSAISADERHELADKFVFGAGVIHNLFHHLRDVHGTDTAVPGRFLWSTLTMEYLELSATRPRIRVCRETLCIKILGTLRVHSGDFFSKFGEVLVCERVEDLVTSLPYACLVELHSMYEQADYQALDHRFRELMAGVPASG